MNMKTHCEDAVPDKVADYTSEAIALYPADTQEEGFYFYIPLTKDGSQTGYLYEMCGLYGEYN